MEDDKSLTSMVITVIVALIVTGAVLVPIVGGLAGGNGNGGGSGGTLSNPAPSIPMAYAEEGADSFTITIDAVRHTGESAYPGIFEGDVGEYGYLDSLSITTPNGAINVDVGTRLSAYSDYMYANMRTESSAFIGNEEYTAVASRTLIPLVASDDTIVYYDLVAGEARSFSAPYGDVLHGSVTSLTYNEHNGEYGFDAIVDGSNGGFPLSGGFYYVQKDGDFGAYTRGQFKDGIYVSNNYSLNPFYFSDATVQIGANPIYNEERSVTMVDTGVAVKLNTTISNHRLSSIDWDISTSSHNTGTTTEYTVYPMLIFAPLEVDSNEPGKVYHNTGDMKYSKVTSATNVTIYPYYDDDADEYGFSFQDPAVHPESIVTVSVGESNIFSIFGLDWGASLSDYGIEEDGNYTYVGVWHLWGKVGELAENPDPDSEIDYYGTISIVKGNATFNGFKAVWDGSQETTAPVEFALSNMMYYPDPEGNYVCPIVYDDQENKATYTKIYADGATEIFGSSNFMTISGTIENPVITIVAENMMPPNANITVQSIFAGDVLTGFILDAGVGSPLSVNTEEGDNPDNSPLVLGVVSATVGEESSGGSGGSGSDLGTVGTIMAVIPVFVVLAILIYAVQYMRTKPEGY